MSAPSPDLILEARNITKRYPGTVALDRVTFRVYRNKVNVLIGENGAGKSTLMRVLSGVENADEGRLLLEGSTISIGSPREAAAHGIAIVHQELSILPNLDISENIFAGRELVRAAIVVDRFQEDARSTVALNQLRKPIPVQTAAARLSLGCRQIVELARALAHGAKVLILDEPSSALSAVEVDSLFRVVEDLKRSGLTIIYISHRLHELLYLGDHFTVLRSGRMVGEAPRAEVTRRWIVETMSGRADGGRRPERPPAGRQPAVLTVSRLSVTGSDGDDAARAPLHDLELILHKGELLGVYGLLGAGRTELLEVLAGCRAMASGEILLYGRTLQIRSVADAIRSGIILVPEDRQRDGLIPDLSIRENVALVATKGPFVSRKQESVRVRQLANQLGIAASDLELPVTTLSGGNQQKVLLARCLMQSPSVLLLDEPTRGVDAGAKAEIYRILRDLAAGGLSIIFTSSEIEEVRTLADRAIVLCQGTLSAEFVHDELTDQALFSAASPKVPYVRST